MAASAPDPGVAVLRLERDDASTARRLRRDLESAVRGEAPVVVDLTAATVLDAATMRVLLDGLAECERQERTLVLLVPDDERSAVRRLFQVSGLESLLPVASSWDEALGRAANGAPARARYDAPGWTSPLS